MVQGAINRQLAMARARLGDLNSVGGGVPVAAVTYWADLKCDDNAANTTVSNDGTGGAWASTSSPTMDTEDLWSDEDPAQDGLTTSFRLAAPTPAAANIHSGAAIPSNKFQVTFWYKWTNPDGDGAAPATHEVIFASGDGDLTGEVNEVIFYRLGQGTQFKLYGYGASGTAATRTTSGLTPDTNWHKIIITIDASTTPWTTMTASYDGTEFTFDVTTMPTNAANFGGLLYFGPGGASAYTPNCYITGVLVEDQS